MKNAIVKIIFILSLLFVSCSEEKEEITKTITVEFNTVEGFNEFINPELTVSYYFNPECYYSKKYRQHSCISKIEVESDVHEVEILSTDIHHKYLSHPFLLDNQSNLKIFSNILIDQEEVNIEANINL